MVEAKYQQASRYFSRFFLAFGDILNTPMALENEYRTIGRQLLRWGVASIVMGVVITTVGVTTTWWVSPFFTGLGIQCVIWGAVDSIVAGFSFAKVARILKHEPDEEWEAGRLLRFRRTLRINAGLDVLYCAAGVAIIALLPGPLALGHGVGIVVQSVFLFAFDAFHASQLPKFAPPWYDPQP